MGEILDNDGNSDDSRNHSSNNQIVSVKWEAPLPPPAILKEFDEIVPGSAKQLMAEVKKESAHRREIEKLVVKAQIWDQIRGQFYAFIIVLVAFFIAAIAIYRDHAFVAAIFGAGGIGSIVFAFLREKSEQRGEKS